VSNIKVCKLQEICEFQLGYQFRRKPEYVSDGNYRIAQMKDIHNYTLNTSELSKVKLEDVKEDYLIDKGTVLFTPRGFNNGAALVMDKLENTIAAGLFYIIRVKDSSVLPEYITWYLNQKPAQKYFASNRAGTSIPTINIGFLKELEIKIPDLEVQEKIAHIFYLSLREKELTINLQEKKQQLIEAVLLEKINI